MNKLITVWGILCLCLWGCNQHNLADLNLSMPNNSWAYAKSIKTSFAVTAPNRPYQVYFTLRHTAEYRYANLFVIVKLKGNGLNKQLRYQFKLAQADGSWTGKGSGAIFSHNFLIFKNYRFPKPGTYTLEVEQNMRDNPLLGISDIGLRVSNPQIND